MTDLVGKPTLEDVTGGSLRVLNELITGPTLAGMANVIPQVAVQAAGAIAVKAGKAEILNHIRAKLEEAYDTHSGNAYFRPNDDNDPGVEEWDEGMDEAVEALFEQHSTWITAGWLGEHCTDNRLHEDGAIERLAKSFTEDAWRVLTFVPEKDNVEAHYMSNVDLLAAIGLSSADIEAAMATRTKPTETEVEEIKVATITETKKRLAEHMAAQGFYDRKALCLDLEDACETDDILAQAAITRLGGQPEDAKALRSYRESNLIFGADDWAPFADSIEALSPAPATAGPADVVEASEVPADEEFDMSMFGGDVVATPAPPTPGAPPPAPPLPVAPAAPPVAAPAPEKPKRVKAADGPPEGAVPAEALTLLKENAGLNDEQLGSLVGVSRATFANYCKGKAFLVPQDVHRTNLVAMIEQKREALSQALSMIEGA